MVLKQGTDMEVEEKSQSSSDSMPLVKVYRLNIDGKWDEQGTGHVTVDYLEGSEELGLFTIYKEDNKTSLLHRIIPDDIYRKQEETIISWKDLEAHTELALSFEKETGCTYIWDRICNEQRRLQLSTLSLNNTIISWKDLEAHTELALSFEEETGRYTWDHICNGQRRLQLSTLNLNSKC